MATTKTPDRLDSRNGRKMGIVFSGEMRYTWGNSLTNKLRRKNKMGKPGFKAKAQELIKLMVDTIADKEYAKLASSIPPKPSWASYIHAEPTFENACLGFGKWLVEQLTMWEEDEDKKFVVDHFQKSCMENIDDAHEARLETNNRDMVSYNPTSFGEQLDFWFEIEFFIENGQIKAVFDVNI